MATKAPSVSETKIREIAHDLWVEAGKPEGQAEDHWFRAIELAAKAAKTKSAAKKPAANAKPAAKAAPAAKPSAKKAPAKKAK
jgi:Protein of unknown function (DUF2934)